MRSFPVLWKGKAWINSLNGTINYEYSTVFQGFPPSYVKILTIFVVISSHFQEKDCHCIVTTPRSQRCDIFLLIRKCDTKNGLYIIEIDVEVGNRIKLKLVECKLEVHTQFLPCNSPFQTFSNNLPLPLSVMTKWLFSISIKVMTIAIYYWYYIIIICLLVIICLWLWHTRVSMCEWNSNISDNAHSTCILV